MVCPECNKTMQLRKDCQYKCYYCPSCDLKYNIQKINEVYISHKTKDSGTNIRNKNKKINFKIKKK